MSNYIIEEKSNLITCCFIALLIVSCPFSTLQAQYWQIKIFTSRKSTC